MKKRTKLIIGLAIALAVASLILIITLLVIKKPKFEDQFSKVAIDYYRETLEPYYSEQYSKLGFYVISLDALDRAGIDVSKFKDKSCDPNETYVKLNFTNPSTYDVEVHMQCEE